MNLIDLGLPSGTLWADTDYRSEKVPDGFFSISDVAKIKSYLPTEEQCEELIANCSYEYKQGWVRFIGPNKKAICFRLDGAKLPNDKQYANGVFTLVWTNTQPYMDRLTSISAMFLSQKDPIMCTSPYTNKLRVRMIKSNNK